MSTLKSTNDAAATDKKSLFVMEDGRNLAFTFMLVSSLFLLWGLCNGMIDVMDKHFQDELGLTKSQSAWVQFAHYLGYFLMAMPAGWLAVKLGYKGGIIVGLLMVAAGGFWFWPATSINAMAKAGSLAPTTAFVAYLVGVCAIAGGLTFLETVANPYTTVLGPKRYAATRINLAQSCNGVGWICGPIIGAAFFYSTDAAGRSTGSETLYIPYVIVGFVVLLLSIVFYFAYMPDIKTKDDYHLDDPNSVEPSTGADREVNHSLVYVLLLLNAAVVVGVFAMILSLILSALNASQNIVWIASSVLLAVVAAALIPYAGRISHHSIWSHPHFSAATLTQFLYVAAQAGIFSFLINYMTEEVPPLPASCQAEWTRDWIEVKTKVTRNDLRGLPSLADKLKQKPDPVSAFLASQLSDETKRALGAYEGSTTDPHALQAVLIQDLNEVVKRDPKNAKNKPVLYDPHRFSGVALREKTRQLLSQEPEGAAHARLNRLLLEDAYPGELAYRDGVLGISDKFAAILATVGFVCFLTGRFTGAGLLRKFSAHKILGLYGLLSLVACLLVFFKLGWLSVACVFLSYFFMSIMFPTIFALGIFGLGVRAKKASAYIVMAIMGGALLPKLMGFVADQYDMSRGFIVPAACFVFVACYGLLWPKLSKAESLNGAGAAGGH